MRICSGATVAVAALLLLIPGTALATSGYLMLLADEQGGCEFADPGNGLVTTYVVHKLWLSGDNATAVRFRIQPPETASWMYLTFNTPFVSIGAANTDLSVAYGQCLTETITVGQALWFSPIATPPCGQVRITPAQGFQHVIAADCEFAELSIAAYGGVVNPDPGCCCDCWSTRPSTWGSVKALYR